MNTPSDLPNRGEHEAIAALVARVANTARSFKPARLAAHTGLSQAEVKRALRHLGYAAYPADVSESMHAYIRDGAYALKSIDAAPAVAWGLLSVTEFGYATTEEGRVWQVENMVNNGSTRQEAIHALDYLD